MQLPNGVARRGHFRFESGHHGDLWLDLDLLVSHPGHLRDAARLLATRLAAHPADIVCGPLEGGAFAAQWVAAELGTRFTYTRREPGPRYVAPRSPALEGLRAIIVDDAINAGSATTATARELARRGCEVVALASVVACLPAGTRVGPRLGIPQVHLAEVTSGLWEPADCPLCDSGVPLEA